MFAQNLKQQEMRTDCYRPVYSTRLTSIQRSDILYKYGVGFVTELSYCDCAKRNFIICTTRQTLSDLE